MAKNQETTSKPGKSSSGKSKSDLTTLKKRSGRYAVVNAQGKFVNGAEKIKVLTEKGLIKLKTPKAKTEAPAASENP